MKIDEYVCLRLLVATNGTNYLLPRVVVDRAIPVDSKFYRSNQHRKLPVFCIVFSASFVTALYTVALLVF